MNATPETFDSPAFTVAGFCARTSNADEMAGKGRIGELWKTFGERAGEGPENAQPVSVYHDYESDHMGPYNLLVGCRVANAAAAPDGWQTLEVPPAKYLVFPVPPGPMPDVLVASWMQIWNFFSDDAVSWKRTFTHDFEEHGETTKIYIAVV